MQGGQWRDCERVHHDSIQHSRSYQHFVSDISGCIFFQQRTHPTPMTQTLPLSNTCVQPDRYVQTNGNGPRARVHKRSSVVVPFNLDSCSVFTTILMMFRFGSRLKYDGCWNVTMRNACMSCDVVYFLRCRPRGSPRSTPSPAPALVVVHVCALGL